MMMYVAATWFDVEEDKTTSVYVSGLPSDITLDEFKSVMAKCGLILYDHITKGLKLKLYKDEEGNYKGDGLCGYIKVSTLASLSCSCHGHIIDLTLEM